MWKVATNAYPFPKKNLFNPAELLKTKAEIGPFKWMRAYTSLPFYKKIFSEMYGVARIASPVFFNVNFAQPRHVLSILYQNFGVHHKNTLKKVIIGKKLTRLDLQLKIIFLRVSSGLSV